MRPTSARSQAYAWLAFLLSSCFVLYKYVLQISPSIMTTELIESFQLSGAMLGNLSACYFYAYLCMQIPVGILLDRFQIKRTLTLAILICALGIFLFSQANSLLVAGFGRLLIGLGGAFSAVGTMKVITLFFKEKQFALISGIMMTIGMCGAIIGQAPIAYWLSMSNWRQVCLILAIVGAGLATLVFIIISEKQTIKKPKQIETTALWDGILIILRNRQSWLIAVYSGIAFSPISAFSGLWGVPFLVQSHHLSSKLAASMASLSFIGFALGAPIGGWLSSRINRRKPVMVLGTALALLLLTLILYTPIKSTLITSLLLTLFGFFTSFFFVSFTYMKEINPPHVSGTAIGLINMFNAIFGAITIPLVGKLLDISHHRLIALHPGAFSTQDYQHSLFVLPAILLIALIIQCFIRETHCIPFKND